MTATQDIRASNAPGAWPVSRRSLNVAGYRLLHEFPSPVSATAARYPRSRWARGWPTCSVAWIARIEGTRLAASSVWNMVAARRPSGSSRGYRLARRVGRRCLHAMDDHQQDLVCTDQRNRRPGSHGSVDETMGQSVVPSSAGAVRARTISPGKLTSRPSPVQTTPSEVSLVNR